MMTPAALAKEVISFGPFSLVASERLLTREGATVELSARALDILIALLSRPNEVGWASVGGEAWLVPDRPTLLAARDHPTVIPQSPATHICLSRLARDL
jgi:hypothetical protein